MLPLAATYRVSELVTEPYGNDLRTGTSAPLFSMMASSESRSRNRSNVLVAVCTYNEAANIVAVLDGLRNSMPGADLLVVDDQSPDGTASLASDWFATERQRRDSVERREQEGGFPHDGDPVLGDGSVIVRENERGLGGAIRLAILAAVEGEYEFFLNLDADRSHSPAELPSLLERLQSDAALDVVVGSRYIAGGAIEGWPLRRRLMSRLVNRFATLVLRLPVSDCSGSMRCYRVSRLRELSLDGLRNNGYALLEELLVRLRLAGAKMGEVPIRFVEREAGKSKLTTREAITSAIAIVRLIRLPT